MNVVEKAKKILLEELPGVLAIYVFGSYSSKVQNENSDLDLAVLCDEKLDKEKLWNISQKIASFINIDVDLIDLLNASTVFAFQIITKSKIIYCLDEKKKKSFENKIYSMYLRLNDTRKGIIENIKKRKGIY